MDIVKDSTFLWKSNERITLLAGRPGTGKVALAISHSVALSINEGKNVLILGAENGMSMESAMAQIQACKALNRSENNISARNDGQIHLVRVLGKPSIEELKKKIITAGEIDVVVLDYILSFVPRRRSKDAQANEMVSFMAGVRQIAENLNISFVLISTVSRTVEKRASEPVLSDIPYIKNIQSYIDSAILLFFNGLPDDEGANIIWGTVYRKPYMDRQFFFLEKKPQNSLQ